MAIITLRNGYAVNLDNADAQAGEPLIAFNDDKSAAQLYIGDGNGNKIPVGGSGGSGDVIEYGIAYTGSDPDGVRVTRQNGVITTGDATNLYFNVLSSGAFESAFDAIYPWSEMKRETINGNVMVRVPKYYIKQEDADGTHYDWVCKEKLTGYRCAGIFLNADGSENDYYYIGAYVAVSMNNYEDLSANEIGIGKSQPGFPVAEGLSPWLNLEDNITLTQHRTAAKANGDGWGLTPVAEVCDFWNILIPIEFGTRNVRRIARGIDVTEYNQGWFTWGRNHDWGWIDNQTDNTGDADISGDWEYNYITGECDDMAPHDNGIKHMLNYWDVYVLDEEYDISYYHEYGSSSTRYSASVVRKDFNNQNFKSPLNGGFSPIVYRGIEHPWGIPGASPLWIDGMICVNGKVYVTNDRDKFGSSNLSDYTQLSYTPPGGYVKTLGTDANAPYCRLPSESVSSSGAYFNCENQFPASGNDKQYAIWWGNWAFGATTSEDSKNNQSHYPYYLDDHWTSYDDPYTGYIINARLSYAPKGGNA